MDRKPWITPLPPWLLVLLLLSLLAAQPAVAADDATEVQSYERHFGVSRATANAHLETQDRGAGIVRFLRGELGESYAGAWFDNDTGEFVVPISSIDDRRGISADLSKSLGENYRTAVVESTWEELETAQGRLDEDLYTLIERQKVQTSLDPRTNSVVVHVASDIGESARDTISHLATNGHPLIEIRYEPASLLRAAPFACRDVPGERSCGKPLRGGVLIYPPEGGGPSCSTAFKAVGNVNGNRFMLTAGHCAPVGANRTSYDENPYSRYVGLTEQSSFPGSDYAKIRVNGYGKWWEEGLPSWPSMIAYWGQDQERSISSESYSYLGQWVCHAGIASGSSCGNVAALHKTVSYKQGSVHNLSEVKGNQFCAIPGDSGGPVFSGNTALGIFSGSLETSCGGNLGYYTEITDATNAMGVSVGPRLGIPPTVETDPAIDVQELQATLNGTIDPHWAQTSYQFQYGTSTAYGSSTAPVNAGSGGPTSANATILNLHPATTYHYRLVAYNASGTSYGPDRQFVTTSAPAAVNTGSAINVYSRSSSGALFQKACCFGGEGWTGWWHMGSPLEQGITSGPAAAMHFTNLNVYARAANGRLYQKACCFGSEGWTPWWDMGSPPAGDVTSSAAAIMHGSNFNVYVRGGDKNLYQKWCCSGAEGWSSWWNMGSPQGAGLTSSPAVVDAGGGVINVYARAANGRLYQKACCFGSEGWTAWWDMGSPPGGGITSSPAAVNTGSAVNVYVAAADGHLYQKACCFGSEGWTPWWDMGSPPQKITSGPAAVNAGGGVINVYARSANNHVYQKACCFGSEGWTAWWDMGSPP